MCFLKAPIITLVSLLYWGQIMLLARGAPMSQSNSQSLLAGFILRVILAPWLPEVELCNPPTATHAWSLPSPSRWPCPMPLSMWKQVSVQGLCQLILGGTALLYTWQVSICEEGFLFRHKYLKLLFIIQCSWGDCSGEMLTGGGMQSYALWQRCSASEKLTEELFFFPYLVLSCCSLSLLGGDSSQDYASFLCWAWAFLSAKLGAKPPLASVARTGAQAPLCLQLSSEILLKLPFQVIPFPGGTQDQIPLASWNQANLLPKPTRSSLLSWAATAVQCPLANEGIFRHADLDDTFKAVM